MRDFAPLGMLGSSPAMLVARKELQLRHVADMVARAQARPGELPLATVAAYIGELIEAVADIELNLILYRGAAAATDDLLGGNVDMMSGTASDMMQLLRSGRFVALGVSGSAPLSYAPEVRPIVETLPRYRGGQWYGLYAPAAVPAPVLARLRQRAGRRGAAPGLPPAWRRRWWRRPTSASKASARRCAPRWKPSRRRGRGGRTAATRRRGAEAGLKAVRIRTTRRARGARARRACPGPAPGPGEVLVRAQAVGVGACPTSWCVGASTRGCRRCRRSDIGRQGWWQRSGRAWAAASSGRPST
jgi:hypothetical protein